jgi:hypothetical protein
MADDEQEQRSPTLIEMSNSILFVLLLVVGIFVLLVLLTTKGKGQAN